MRVLIDGHMLGTGEGGNERYIKNLASGLQGLKGIETKIASSSEVSRNNLVRLFYDLPKISFSFKADIIHSTYILPFVKNAKFVVTVHDFSFRRYPQFFSGREKLIFNYLLPFSLARADAVIVPSIFSEKEALKFYPQLKGKLFVTYEAADKIFRPVDKISAKSFLYKKYAIKDPFLLVLNSKNPKKNINRVINAFRILRKTFPGLSLVIIGGSFNIKKPESKLEKVKIIERVTDEELVRFYNACEAFIYYSLYEGFGLPVIEALNCKTAVIASNIEVLKEITKNSITYANPLKAEDLAGKLNLLLEDRQMRGKIIENGLRIARTYSWKKTVEDTHKVYNFVLMDK